jgi:tetratricopeptide (TPR) repeat protein
LNILCLSGKNVVAFLFFAAFTLCILPADGLYAEGDSGSYISTAGKTPKDIYEEGNRLVSAGEFKKADALYNYALSVSKDSRLKGQIRSAKKKIAKPLRKIEKTERKEKAAAEKMTRKEVAALSKKGRQLFSEGSMDGAQEAFTGVLKLSPSDEEAKVYLEKKIPAKREKLEDKKTEKK